MPLAVSKDELCFVKQRQNQIVVTSGAMLHNIHFELQIRTPSLPFTVSATYFLELTQKLKEKKLL